MADLESSKPWQPGQSGNPAGMKKGTRHLSTLLQEALEKGVDVDLNKRKVKCSRSRNDQATHITQMINF